MEEDDGRDPVGAMAAVAVAGLSAGPSAGAL